MSHLHMVKEQSYSKINWNMGDVQWKLQSILVQPVSLTGSIADLWQFHLQNIIITAILFQKILNTCHSISTY